MLGLKGLTLQNRTSPSEGHLLSYNVDRSRGSVVWRNINTQLITISVSDRESAS